MPRLHFIAYLFGCLLCSIGTASAEPQLKRFVYTGVFSSGSGMAGSAVEKDGRSICFLEADIPAKASAQRHCSHNETCEIVAMIRVDGDGRVVERVLSINGRAVPNAEAGLNKGDASTTDQADEQSCPARAFKAFAEKSS
ncbi:hypothetical protein ACN6KF_006782 [Labrys sp. La1]|uniref:hypothetical protein n=1 Tax=Labrys sp. La1 TaxID=3404917 RepID=UPI003EBC15A0